MLVLCMADRVGALHDVLQAFQHRSVNLARIESRPSRTKIWCSKFPPPSARPLPSLCVHASISILSVCVPVKRLHVRQSSSETFGTHAAERYNIHIILMQQGVYFLR